LRRRVGEFYDSGIIEFRPPFRPRRLEPVATAGDRRGSGARTALVTGASRGLGAATTINLAAQGWRVYAAARTESALDELRDNASEGYAERIIPVPLDVSDSIATATAVAQILQPLDAVVCCAGVTAVRPFEDMASGDFDAILDVNLRGALSVTRATLPAMRAAGRGHLIYVSSLAAVLPSPGISAYATSKAALESWASCLRQELHPFGVQVAVLRAGLFSTQMLTAPEAGPPGTAYGATYTALIKAAPRVERLGKNSEHFARAVAKVLDTSRPRLINPTGPGSRITPLFVALPRSVVEAVMRRTAGSR
jgi:NAD(P)-dependent dehydrogenase (short-subunit alcohol dehydrogenase family)